MSTGSAILFSAILLSLIVVFVVTRNSRLWHRLALTAMWALIGITVTASSFFVYSQWSTWFPKPEVLSELWGVRLGDSEKEVLFKKGQPKRTCTYVGTNLKLLFYDIGYDNADQAIVFVDGERGVWQVLYAGSLYMAEQKQAAKINSGQTTEQTIAVWGRPSSITERDSATVRTYWFEKFNLAVSFDTNKAEAIRIGQRLGERVKGKCE